MFSFLAIFEFSVGFNIVSENSNFFIEILFKIEPQRFSQPEVRVVVVKGFFVKSEFLCCILQRQLLLPSVFVIGELSPFLHPNQNLSHRPFLAPLLLLSVLFCFFILMVNDYDLICPKIFSPLDVKFQTPIPFFSNQEWLPRITELGARAQIPNPRLERRDSSRDIEIFSIEDDEFKERVRLERLSIHELEVLLKGFHRNKSKFNL